MEQKMIQLPPVPEDMSAEFVEALWVYAKMHKGNRECIKAFAEAFLADSNIRETEYAKALETGSEEPDVKEFSELLRKLFGHLFAQACDAAAVVYRDCFMGRKSVEEVAEQSGFGESIIRVMSEYFAISSDDPK